MTTTALNTKTILFDNLALIIVSFWTQVHRWCCKQSCKDDDKYNIDNNLGSDFDVTWRDLDVHIHVHFNVNVTANSYVNVYFKVNINDQWTSVLKMIS